MSDESVYLPKSGFQEPPDINRSCACFRGCDCHEARWQERLDAANAEVEKVKSCAKVGQEEYEKSVKEFRAWATKAEAERDAALRRAEAANVTADDWRRTHADTVRRVHAELDRIEPGGTLDYLSRLSRTVDALTAARAEAAALAKRIKGDAEIDRLREELDAANARAEAAEKAKRAADLALGLTEECLAAARKRHEAERDSRTYWQGAYDTMWKERDAARAEAAHYREFVEYVSTRKRLPSEHGMDVLAEVQKRATRALAGEVKHE